MLKTMTLALFPLFFATIAYSSESNPKAPPFLYPRMATGLHIAVAEDCLSSIAYFTARGANPLAADEYGITPLDIAKNHTTIGLLLSSPRLETYIQAAASKGQTRILATVFSSYHSLFLPHQKTVGHLEQYNRNRHRIHQSNSREIEVYTLRLSCPCTVKSPNNTKKQPAIVRSN